MKQYVLLFWVFTTALLLTACSESVTNLVWLTPGEGGVVSGIVVLRAQAAQEPFLANVVFSANGEAVAKAYEEDGVYNALWDSRGAAGDVSLGAKPYGGKAVERTVNVAQRSDN